MSCEVSISLLIFCLNHLATDVSGVLKSSILIVLLLISPLMSVNICFIYLGAPLLGVCMLTNIISSYMNPLIIV